MMLGSDMVVRNGRVWLTPAEATCWWCGEPATLRDRTATSEASQRDRWCEACARDEYAKRLGECQVLQECVSALVRRLRENLSDDEIRRAVDDDLEGREALFGALRSEYDWVKATEDTNRRVHQSYLSQFERVGDGAQAMTGGSK
jgi:hypothetical protein